ncbi:MAG TPA: glycosyltransferase family 39 protein [Xanthobacteraceae bacterium]|nr:glycosyltransferase family 39 protein [Xanthobacteraceae bacterium]
MTVDARQATALERRDVGSRAVLAVWAIAAASAAVHLALAGRYDIFRNELYFIVCGRHPDFGYVDQPPLVPLLAAATQLFGDNIWLLRLPAVAAAAALPLVTAALSRQFGGGAISAVVAAAAAALAPALAGFTATLTTSTFEPLAWTICSYFLTRAVAEDDRRAVLWAGVAAGIAMEAKYGIAMWLIGLAVGIVATPERRILLWRQCWIAVALAALLAAPSLAWQATHGWPFFSAVFQPAVAGQDYLGTPASFALWQIIQLNPLLCPLWIAGLVAPFLVDRLGSARFLSIAAAVATVIDYGGGGKDYYLFPVYPTLLAVGAAAFGNMATRAAAVWLAAAFVSSVAMAPAVLPILEPDTLALYLDRTGLRPPPNERAAIGAPLTQVFSDEFGWRELERQVASVYRSSPEEERRQAAIIASNYGEAAAIDVYGRSDALPPALSGENQYFVWGTHGFDGDIIIHIGGDPERWRRFCRSVETVTSFGVSFAMPYENGRPIFVCRGPRAPLAQIWPRFKRY